MGDRFDVEGRGKKQFVAEREQRAGHRDFVADFRYLDVGRVAVRSADAGQVRVVVRVQAGFGSGTAFVAVFVDRMSGIKSMPARFGGARA